MKRLAVVYGLPSTFWTKEAVDLLDSTADVLDRWCQEQSASGNSEDATTLALMSNAFRAWLHEGGLDAAFDAAAANAFGRERSDDA